jgi:hypothetical protein
MICDLENFGMSNEHVMRLCLQHIGLFGWSCPDHVWIWIRGMSWSHFRTKKGFDIKSYHYTGNTGSQNSLQRICNCYHAQLVFTWDAECILHKARMNFGVVYQNVVRIQNSQKLVLSKFHLTYKECEALRCFQYGILAIWVVRSYFKKSENDWFFL